MSVLIVEDTIGVVGFTKGVDLFGFYQRDSAYLIACLGKNRGAHNLRRYCQGAVMQQCAG